jgi:hypothetical protein
MMRKGKLQADAWRAHSSGNKPDRSTHKTTSGVHADTAHQGAIEPFRLAELPETVALIHLSRLGAFESSRVVCTFGQPVVRRIVVAVFVDTLSRDAGGVMSLKEER